MTELTKEEKEATRKLNRQQRRLTKSKTFSVAVIYPDGTRANKIKGDLNRKNKRRMKTGIGMVQHSNKQ